MRFESMSSLMALEKIASLLLLPVMLAGESAQSSDTAKQLVKKPRLGSAQLTWVDGRRQKGHIARVTDQFVAFQTDTRPMSCENVKLSEIATVQWLRTSRGPGAGSQLAGVLFVGAILAPFYVGHAVADPFKRMSPPLKPLGGSWESGGPSRALIKSSLEFKGNTVQHRTMIGKQGRWLVEQDRLRLIYDGEPESATPFHFDCEELILDDSAGTFREWSDRKHATQPMVGNWHGSNSNLNIQSDGSFAEQKWEVRKGTFENSAASVKMHWADSTGFGGAEWIAQIKQRHIFVSVGGVTTEYHYVPPVFVVDL